MNLREQYEKEKGELIIGTYNADWSKLESISVEYVEWLEAENKKLKEDIIAEQSMSSGFYSRLKKLKDKWNGGGFIRVPKVLPDYKWWGKWFDKVFPEWDSTKGHKDMAARLLWVEIIKHFTPTKE